MSHQLGEGLELLNIDPSDLVTHELVGSGITAEVFRGEWKSHIVAIKVILEKGPTISPKQQLAFAREFKVLHQIHHPNLVKLHGVCFGQHPLKIVTEFCAGGAAFDLLHNQEDVVLCFQQKMKMCHDVALAMEYLHNFNPMIIHRDLKSLNLLLAEPITSPHEVPLAKVSDFGVAKMKDDVSWENMTVQAGTKHWMAPEVWSGHRYDEKVDVYSYAMVFYEIICREIPFDEEEPGNVGKLTLSGQRPTLDAVPPEIPPQVVAIMTDAWAQLPQDRPSFTNIVPRVAAFL